MKKIFSILLFFCLFMEAREQGRHNTTKKQKTSQKAIPTRQLIAELGLGIEYYKYKEPKVMQIAGAMLNLNGTIGVIKGLFRFQTDAYFATHIGINVYDGGLFDIANNVTTPYSTKSTDYYGGVVPKIGIALTEQKKDLFFAYMGLGYRFLHNLLIDKPNIKAAYVRQQGYLFLPIGMSGEVPINKKVSFIGSLEYRILLFGHNVSKISDLGYDSDLFFTQDTGYGVRIALGSKIFLENPLKMQIYYDYWDIEESNTVPAFINGVFRGDFHEPKNFTRAVGFLLSYSF